MTFPIVCYYYTVADGREDKLLPVLVFIHGEEFGYGTGNPYDPSMLVSQGNIVAVTLNYRLGILGKFYFSTFYVRMLYILVWGNQICNFQPRIPFQG